MAREARLNLVLDPVRGRRSVASVARAWRAVRMKVESWRGAPWVQATCEMEVMRVGHLATVVFIFCSPDFRMSTVLVREGVASTPTLHFAVRLLSRVQLCNPMDCSTPGFPVLHRLPEFAQTHVHRVGDAMTHLILCRPLFLLSSIFPSIRVFSTEAVLLEGSLTRCPSTVLDTFVLT